MPKKIKSSSKKIEEPKQTLSFIAQDRNISSPELNAIIIEENKRRKKNIDKSSQMTMKEVEELYKRYFGINLKDKF